MYRKFKVCPNCGFFQWEDHPDSACRFCKASFVSTNIGFPGLFEAMEGMPIIEAEYIKEHILPYPEKREAYKNRKEIQELENELDSKVREAKRSAESPSINTIKCPTCGSIRVKKLTGFDRGVSVAVLGPFSKCPGIVKL